MKKKTDKAKKTEEEIFREQQKDLLKFARELRKEEEQAMRERSEEKDKYEPRASY